MKNPIEMLNNIKNLLGVKLESDKVEAKAETKEIILAQLKLEDGVTVLESEDFKMGKEVFILTEDQQVALPIGEYLLEDGRTLDIKEDGVINAIEVKAEESIEEVADEQMDATQYPSREEFDQLKNMVIEIKSLMGEQEEYKKNEKESEEAAELKEELSKPAAQPIKHNPEAKSETKKVLYSQKRGSTTLDIVMNKILNK